MIFVHHIVADRKKIDSYHDRQSRDCVIFFNDMAFSQNPLPLWIQSCFIKAMFKIVISLKYRHFLSQLGWITRIRSLLVSFNFFARQISELVKQIKIPWGGFNLNLLLDELKNSGMCVRHLSVCEGFSSKKSISSTSYNKMTNCKSLNSPIGVEYYVKGPTKSKEKSKRGSIAPVVKFPWFCKTRTAQHQINENI